MMYLCFTPPDYSHRARPIWSIKPFSFQRGPAIVGGYSKRAHSFQNFRGGVTSSHLLRTL